jgi:hypothetical protein
VIGAAPLASDLEEFWSRLGLPIIQGYGLTETAPRAYGYATSFGLNKSICDDADQLAVGTHDGKRGLIIYSDLKASMGSKYAALLAG